MECFCGCGRSVPARRRRTNTKGANVAEDLRELRTIVVPRLAVEHANHRLDALRRQTDRLLEQGDFVLNDLRGYVHGEYDRITREYGDFHREAASLIRPLRDKAEEERRSQGRGLG